MRKRGVIVTMLATLFSYMPLTGCGGSQQGQKTTQSPPAEQQATEPGRPAYVVQDVVGGTIEGRVLLQGAVPPPRRTTVTQDSDTCGKQREIYPVRVRNGGVDEAVVWIDDIERGKPFAFPPAQINQKDCTFLPHVLVMAPGDIKVDSEDPIPHNVHTYAQNNREYNESQNQLRPEISLSFARPDRISMRCDLHGWMQAYVIVAKNPYYAVTSDGGRFTLDHVPPGHYHLKVWSESLGEQDKEIDVGEGKSVNLDFTLQSQNAQTQGG